MRTLIVTAADEGFMPLLRGLIGSLRQWEKRPFTDIAFFDLGLTPESREWIARFAKHIAEPGWDLPVDEALRAKSPELRALTVRPFLPHYFPGYDIYLWMDADTWVQEKFAVEDFLTAASAGQLAAVPEAHPAYPNNRHMRAWRVSRIRECYGWRSTWGRDWSTYLNAGIFALRSDAPHWESWTKWFRKGLEATGGKQCSDQSALNHAVWEDDLPVNPLPPVCNWLSHLALPAFDAERARFCEPIGGRRTIGILHLTGSTKSRTVEYDAGGVARKLSLRFPDPGQPMA